MPRASNHLALARQWEMLKRLPSRAPGITAAEMTHWLADQGYAVSKRTVERDLNDLSHVFGIRCNDASMPYGWHWMQGAEMDFGSIELTDAVSLNLAEQLLKQMLPAPLLAALQPKFDQARKKLAALDAHPMAKLTQKVRYIATSLDLRPPSLRDAILTIIQQALIDERQLAVRYARFNERAKDLTLNPLSLIQRGTVPYLIATAEPYTAPHIFAIHRVEKAEALEAKAKPPKGYSADQFIEEGFMHFGPATEIKLKARLSHELATYLSETPISEDQRVDFRKGGYQLEATVHDTWQLHFWIMSQGAQIEILRPSSLRASIAERLQHAAGQYSQESTKP